jgi:hypothetical protein
MREPYVNKGQSVFIDPTLPTDGGVVLDAALIVPPIVDEYINGAPVSDVSHEFILQRVDKKVRNAPNP